MRQAQQKLNGIAAAFARITRQACWNDVIGGIWAALGQWNEMILGQPRHLTIAVDTAMAEPVLNRVPFDSCERSWQRLLSGASSVTRSLEKFKVPFARLLFRPHAEPRQLFRMIAPCLTVNTVAFKDGFTILLTIPCLLLPNFLSMLPMVLFAVCKMSIFMCFIVSLAPLILALASLIPARLITLAQQFGIFAPMAAGIACTTQPMRTAIFTRFRLSAFVAIHSLIIPPLARGCK